jgi:hypothetical protein
MDRLRNTGVQYRGQSTNSRLSHASFQNFRKKNFLPKQIYVKDVHRMSVSVTSNGNVPVPEVKCENYEA